MARRARVMAHLVCRFHEVLPVLQQQYGGLYNIRCNILLLWCALPPLPAQCALRGPAQERRMGAMPSQWSMRVNIHF